MRYWVVIFSFLFCGYSAAEPLRVAVASNFKAPLQYLLEDFKHQTNIDVTLSSASSGVLYQQIIHGAPFDLFLSADQLRPQLLVEQGFALAESQQVYATGQLAFYSPQGQTQVSNIADNQGLTLAFANDKHAPYGIAAKAYVDNVLGGFNGRKIKANNIAQTFQIVHSGNAPAGFVAFSHIKAHQVSAEQYQLLDAPEAFVQQAGVILSASNKTEQASQLFAYLNSKAIKKQLEAMGYQ